MISIAIQNAAGHRQVQWPDPNAAISIVSAVPSLSLKAPEQTLTVSDATESDIAFEIAIIADGHESKRLTIKNHGAGIALESGMRIFRDASHTISLPCIFRVGDTLIEIIDQSPHNSSDLTYETVGAGRHESSAPDSPTVAAWFESLGVLQRSVAGSDEFFSSVAKALFNPGGLDGGMILLPCDGGWNIAASYLPYPQHGITFHLDLVAQCVSQSQTLIHVPEDQSQSSIACPVLGHDGKLLAIVYGLRNIHQRNHRRGIRLLERKFIQLAADSIANALQRIEKETQAARQRVLLEQALSPKVAERLGTDLSLLSGRDHEVTVLFADLRDFSAASQRLGTQLTYQLLTDVMDAFSQAIAQHDGVIIDFYGDGLSAFWNAPLPQPDHQRLACNAGMAMLEALESVSDAWQDRIGGRLRAGIGVQCGVAQVGNSGSSSRIKYGPQGHMVNVASRLENATKSAGAPIIISDVVSAAVGDAFPVRRVCRTRLAGDENVTELVELMTTERPALVLGYEQALDRFERGEFSEAVSLLSELQMQFQEDRVTEFLLQQSLERNRANIDRRKDSTIRGKYQLQALTHVDVQKPDANRDIKIREDIVASKVVKTSDVIEQGRSS